MIKLDEGTNLRVPISVTLAFIAQALTVVWAAAAFYFDHHALKNTVTEMGAHQAKLDARQDNEAIRAEARITASLDRMDGKLDQIIGFRKK